MGKRERSPLTINKLCRRFPALVFCRKTVLFEHDVIILANFGVLVSAWASA